jgi:hypothetical protein
VERWFPCDRSNNHLRIGYSATLRENPTYQNKNLAQRDGQLKRDNRIRLTLSLAILSSPFILRNMAMSQSNITQGPQDPGTKVSIIMDEILRRGEQQRGQVKMSTWVPPTEEDLDKIRKIGHYAIPILDKALDSPQPNRPFLAVKLLELIGGPGIVPPLKKALRPFNPNLVRIASLSALRSAPDSLAVPIIRDSVHDSDPVVSDHAARLLTEYYYLPVTIDGTPK